MKTLFAIGLTGLLAMTAQAQFIQGVNVYSMLTNSASVPFMASGGGTAPGPSTNVPTANAKAVPVGVNGFGLGCVMAGTNNTTTTNVTFTFQFSYDGIRWATNNELSVVLTPLGTNFAPMYTNFPNTTLNVGNISAVRLKSIHHTNTGSIFITNLVITTR